MRLPLIRQDEIFDRVYRPSLTRDLISSRSKLRVVKILIKEKVSRFGVVAVTPLRIGAVIICLRTANAVDQSERHGLAALRLFKCFLRKEGCRELISWLRQERTPFEK